MGAVVFGFESPTLPVVLGKSLVLALSLSFSLSFSLWFLEEPVLSRDFDRDLDRVLVLFFSYQTIQDEVIRKLFNLS